MAEGAEGRSDALAAPDALRLPGPRLRRRILLVARVLIGSAAVITLVAVNWLTAFTLSLFLVVGQAFIVVGALLALGVAVTDLFRSRGVAHVHFDAGETIFEQGDRGDVVYSIVSGEVEAIRREPDGEERVLATMGPGEYFGEMALLSDAPRTATVRAKTPVEAVSMGGADFTALYAYLPDLRRRVEALMKRRQANTSRRSA